MHIFIKPCMHLHSCMVIKNILWFCVALAHSMPPAVPVTMSVCPECGESCHIRCKHCPECEHQFPSSAKRRARPDIHVKNTSNLLQILQKKVQLLYILSHACVSCDLVRPCTHCSFIMNVNILKDDSVCVLVLMPFNRTPALS